MAIKVKKGKGILFEAVPDNGQVGIRVGENGRVHCLFPNRIVLPDDILTKLRKDTVPFLYPPPKPIEYQGASWIVNMCADADEYRNALIGLDQAFGDKLPIFNHPRAVAMTRRDLSAKLLEGIPNLIVPKCVRFKADANNSFQKTFEAEGFKYPVLVRPATSQTGQDLVKIDTPFDWTKVYQTHWYGKHHYMTQFVDYSENGEFTKIRISVVGRDVALRSYRKSSSWLIKGMGGSDDEDINLLLKQHQEFDGWESAIKVANDIASRVDLDFFGMDLGVSSSNFYMFEVNAAMSMSEASVIDAEKAKIMHPIYKWINTRLRDLFLHPGAWKCYLGEGKESCGNVL